METEKKDKLPFWDVLVCKKPNLVTSVYRKPTCAGLLTNKYKNRLNIKVVSLQLYWIGVTKSTTHG